MRKDSLSQCSKTVCNRIRIYFQIITSAICLFLIGLSGVAADAQPDKYYLRIGHGESHDSNEINVTTLGVVSLKDNMVGHFDLSYLDSDTNGQAAALEFGAAGIRINCVSPGLIDREGLARDWPDGVSRWQDRAPLGRLGTAQDVADAVLFLLSPAARWISGTNLVVDGGMSAQSRW